MNPFRIKYKTIFLDPFFLESFLVIFQFVVWYFCTTKYPSDMRNPVRYESTNAIIMFLTFFLLFNFGCLFSKLISFHKDTKTNTCISMRKVKILIFVADLALIISVLTWIFLVRGIFANFFQLVGIMIYQKNYLVMSGKVLSTNESGYGVLFNLIFVPTIVYFSFCFDKKITFQMRRKIKKRIVLLLFFFCFYFLIMVSRSFPIYVVLIISVTYLINNAISAKHLKIVFLLCVLLGFFVLITETTRLGNVYAKKNNVDLFSYETQKYVFDIITQAYISADINNAFILLDSEPGYIFFWGSSFFPLFYSSEIMTSINDMINQKTDFQMKGLNHIFGSWWENFGIFSFLFIFILGFYLEILYINTVHANGQYNFSKFIYILSYPAMFAMTRINIFFLTAYIIPFLYFMVAFILLEILFIET